MTVRQLAHATFHVMGDSLVPTFWTEYFGVQPDTAIAKGEYFTTPSGRISRMPGTSGLWGLRSETFVQSNALEPHLRYLADRLDLTRPGLRDLLERKGQKHGSGVTGAMRSASVNLMCLTTCERCWSHSVE